jgi:hypothetical protein
MRIKSSPEHDSSAKHSGWGQAGMEPTEIQAFRVVSY